jgi:hypothetical protein
VGGPRGQDPAPSRQASGLGGTRTGTSGRRSAPEKVVLLSRRACGHTTRRAHTQGPGAPGRQPLPHTGARRCAHVRSTGVCRPRASAGPARGRRTAEQWWPRTGLGTSDRPGSSGGSGTRRRGRDEDPAPSPQGRMSVTPLLQCCAPSFYPDRHSSIKGCCRGNICLIPWYLRRMI